MRTMHSKSAFLYRQVRRRLQSGRYLPGQRIDPGTIAAEFHVSPTPVRLALYRLVGAGLIADHARDGMHVPLPNEIAMRELYDWMERLLLMACSIGPAPARRNGKPAFASERDPVKRTWRLFDAIAEATRHRRLHLAVKQANDQLAPIRRAKQGLLGDALEELSALEQHWQQRDLPALEAALRAYHARRRQLVPEIVAALSEGREHLH